MTGVETREVVKVVLGSNGLIGRAIGRKFQNLDCHPLRRVVYQDWWDESQIPEIRNTLEYLNPSRAHLQIYLACGILSPKEDSVLIRKVNEFIPINIARALDSASFQLVTFGTIHETFEMHNEYIDSKRRLSGWLNENINKENFLHLRLHTLYDDFEPKEFMFLGALFRCVSEGIELRMSSGKQLREFHHVDDDLEALSFFDQQGYKGIIDLNHGNVISLLDMAKGVSKCFKESGKIKSGFYPDPNLENYNLVFKPQVFEKDLSFREPISSVVGIFQKLMLLR